MLSSLFTEYLNVDIPDYVDYRKERSHLKHKKSVALLRWPNGKPCSLINLWLLDLATKSTGQSLRQYSSNITPYIKYCYRNKVNFTDTTDSDLHDLVEELVDVIDAKHPDKFTRGRNTVKAIMLTVIELLRWLESNIRDPQDQCLIGLADKNAKITIEKLINPVTGRSFYQHPSIPIDTSEQNDKHAMPDNFIEAIENEISNTLINSMAEKSLPQARFVSQDLFRNQQEYLYSRRFFMNWSMKTTGLRPGELVAIPIPPLLNIYKTRDLQIPTLKRRIEPPPIRHFRLNLTGCGQVSRYLAARTKLLDSLIENGIDPLHQDALFLTQQGTPLSAASLAKDFSRLAISAGLGDERVCLSMYRHRFITTEILIHLRELLETDKPNREILSEALIKTICERIRKKIGHGSPSSMWHYFDAAFDLLDFWGSIDAALDNISELDDVKDQLRRLNHLMQRDGATDEQKSMVTALQEQVDAMRAKRSPKQ